MFRVFRYAVIGTQTQRPVDLQQPIRISRCRLNDDTSLRLLRRLSRGGAETGTSCQCHEHQHVDEQSNIPASVIGTRSLLAATCCAVSSRSPLRGEVIDIGDGITVVPGGFRKCPRRELRRLLQARKLNRLFRH